MTQTLPHHSVKYIEGVFEIFLFFNYFDIELKILESLANSSSVSASPLMDAPRPSSSIAAAICSFVYPISGYGKVHIDGKMTIIASTVN